MTGYKSPEVRPFPCKTCDGKVTNANMAVCAECFQRLYDRWSKILFDQEN